MKGIRLQNLRWYLVAGSIIILLWSCGKKNVAGTTDEVETGTPVASTLTIVIPQNNTAAYLYLIQLNNGVSTTTKISISSDTVQVSVSPGQYYIWYSHQNKQDLQSLIIQEKEVQINLHIDTEVALNTTVSSTPLANLEGSVCKILGTNITDTLQNTLNDSLFLSMAVPNVAFVLECTTPSGKVFSKSIHPDTTKQNPLTFQLPQSFAQPLAPDTTSLGPDSVPADTSLIDTIMEEPDTIPPIPQVTTDTIFYTVPDNQPGFALTQPTAINIPANRDVYLFTTIKVAKEPKTWLKINVWSEGGYYKQIDGGIWGGHVAIADENQDGRIWVVLEPILDGEASLPVQFDWW
jgi:hypothetical protein